MSPLFPLKPTHKPVKDYYAALARFHKGGHTTEGNTRSAFADLLKRCCHPYGWHLVEEFQFKGTNKQTLRADGALVDDLTLVHGFWEAKDTNDDLKKEIKAKFAKGYPLHENILFQSPDCAVLYQGGSVVFDDTIDTPEKLLEVLERFFEHHRAHEVDWQEAVTKFADKIPDLAKGVTKILEGEYAKNATFRENFESFAELCRQSINPELADDAIRKMLVQHLLTERIFRKVFNNQEFLQRNVIAAEIEKVIRSITARHFSRDEFLKPLDHFYIAIEKAAESQESYTEKQHFLNAVYEKFFQRFDTKQADTHGIVYTPQPIVDFMVRSVEEILQQDFGRSLSDSGVHILDPFTGTGNFITRIMQQIKRSALPHKYAEELHCNEIMLLPYYIASMNIEHAYMEKAHEYRPFEGICLVDTFELQEGKQIRMFTTENTDRVNRQKKAKITVIIGNPPYRGTQKDESEENKNRSYPTIDNAISGTYVKDSRAQLTNKLRDPYIRAFRWATDRIEDNGVVCFVSNNSFQDAHSLDGMRFHLWQDFDRILHFDLKGNAHSSAERRRREAGNVFGDSCQNSIGITVLVKNGTGEKDLRLYSIDDYMKQGAKLAQIEAYGTMSAVPLMSVTPDKRNNWKTQDEDDSFETLLPLGLKKNSPEDSIFDLFSLGLGTNRDEYAYNTDFDRLLNISMKSVEGFNETRDRFRRLKLSKKELSKAIDTADKRLKWTRNAKKQIASSRSVEFNPATLRKALYRPFYKRFVQFDGFWVEQRYSQHRIFPTPDSENVCFCVNDVQFRSPVSVLATNCIPDLHISAGSDGFQCFPFYRYDPEGGNRRENITDWALAQFRTHYSDETIAKWDIFHAIYAVLHHPEYRDRYAANLKRELPRIPFPPDFHAYAAAGKRLMDLHINYEKQPQYPLEQIEDPKAEVTFRVVRMKLSKDKTSLRYNDFLTLRDIPAKAFAYRLGNRSALEWVVDQYRVSSDSQSSIVQDPNRSDDPKYILRLIGQVITVSLETQQIIGDLPSLQLD